MMSSQADTCLHCNYASLLPTIVLVYVRRRIILITKRRAFILDGEGEREQHVFIFNVVVLRNVNLCHI